jgi:Diacylglycerol kinase catalytic domain
LRGWHLTTKKTRRWLARASFAFMLATVVVAVAGWRSLTLTALTVLGACAVLAGGYWFQANRGVLRWLALVLVVAAPVAIVVAFAWQHRSWPAVVAVVLMLCAAGTAGRAAHAGAGRGHARRPCGPPAAPVPNYEPEVGRGEGHHVRAEGQGAGAGRAGGAAGRPGNGGRGALARQAVADGIDLLGVAGGDGTQALVAGIAAEHGLPFLVISAGTCNHFALDLGLDREDPATCLKSC